MKCINRKKWKEMPKKQRAAYERKRKKTLVLLGAFVLFLAAGGILLARFLGEGQVQEAVPYDRTQRTFGTLAGEHLLVCTGMSQDLCVGESDASLEGVEPEEGELCGLFDIDKKEIPFSAGLHEKTAPLELTKLMTALTAYETLNMEEVVTVEESDVLWEGGAYSSGLSTGDRLAAQQLVNAVLVASAEDACYALARTAGSSLEGFAGLMNEKAQELGMTNTHYVNVTGAEDPEQYTTAYDTYLLLNRLLKYPDLINAMGLSSYTMTSTSKEGREKQVWLGTKDYYVNGVVALPKGVTVLGGKYNAADGNCGTAMLVQNNYGNVYAAVALHVKDSSTMYTRISQMAEKMNP